MPEERHDHIHRGRLPIFYNNFLGGVAWGLGATFGVSIIVAILAFIGSQANLVPIVGSFVSEVIDFVLTHNATVGQ